MKSTDYKKIADKHFNRVQSPEHFGEDIANLIDSLEAESGKADERPKVKFRPLYKAVAVAASLALIAAVSIFLIDRTEKPVQYAFEDTCSTPEEARAELEKTLKLIAASVGRANSILNENAKNVMNSKSIIEKTLRHNENNK